MKPPHDNPFSSQTGMAAYVLIPNLAFEGHRDALLERARKDSGYGCFQYRGDEVAVGTSRSNA